MDLKFILQRVPGINRRFIYYLESQGYISPTRIRKERISRRDYSDSDLRVIHETWKYYSQGFSLQTAYALGVEMERLVCYVTFQAPPRRRQEVLRSLRDIPEVSEASAVYADTADFLVKLSAPREVDIFQALVPLFAQTGVTGVPGLLRTIDGFRKAPGGSEQEGKLAMMAYVLIKVPGKNVEAVMDSLKKIDWVSEASTVYGESDVVARVVVPSQVELDLTVMERIHNIPAVESTRTYLVIGGTHWERQQDPPEPEA